MKMSKYVNHSHLEIRRNKLVCACLPIELEASQIARGKHYKPKAKAGTECLLRLPMQIKARAVTGVHGHVLLPTQHWAPKFFSQRKNSR